MLWKGTENVWLAKKDQFKLHTTDYWICYLLSKFWCTKIKPYHLYTVTCFYLLSAPHLVSFNLLLQSSSAFLCWWNLPPKTTWVSPQMINLKPVLKFLWWKDVMYTRKKKSKQITIARNRPMLSINIEAAFELLCDFYSFSLCNNQARASPKTGGIVHSFEKPGCYKK